VSRHSRTTVSTAAVTAVLFVITAGAFTAIAAAVDERNDAVVKNTSDPRAVLLLVAAVRAQQQRTYSGTEYVCAWTEGSAATTVVEVDHQAGSGTLVRVQPSLAAPGGELREPEHIVQPAPVDPLAVSAVEGGPLDLLRRNYELSMGTSDVTTAQVQARRRDGTMAATFWIDARSGLPVRREVFDSNGRLVRASAFVSLHVQRSAAVQTTSAPTVANVMPETPVTRSDVAALRHAGWVLPGQLPGGMVLYDVREQGSGAGTIVHLSYSDGLSTVSVFVQRGRLATKSLTGWSHARMGGPVYVHDAGLARNVTWNGRGHVYTVVADAPSSAVTALVAKLPHGEHHRGFWGRLKHGMGRVVSWFNPFG
jgi:sigma-E factor negative regulatory protein RseB